MKKNTAGPVQCIRISNLEISIGCIGPVRSHPWLSRIVNSYFHCDVCRFDEVFNTNDDFPIKLILLYHLKLHLCFTWFCHDRRKNFTKYFSRLNVTFYIVCLTSSVIWRFFSADGRIQSLMTCKLIHKSCMHCTAVQMCLRQADSIEDLNPDEMATSRIFLVENRHFLKWASENRAI